MEKLEHYSDCSVLVTKLTITKTLNGKGFLFTVEDQIRKQQLTACMSNSAIQTLITFLNTQRKKK